MKEEDQDSRGEEWNLETKSKNLPIGRTLNKILYPFHKLQNFTNINTRVSILKSSKKDRRSLNFTRTAWL